jgi:hypothetical protein
MVSMPIPDKNSRQAYADLGSPIAGYKNLGEIVDAMPTRVARSGDGAHLDPDLDREVISRAPGWRALFGQTSQAQSHLENSGVGVGDLFIYFGWFREVEEREGRIQWLRGSPEQHVIFGWLQVGEILRVGSNPSVPDWAAYHPHTVAGAYPDSNTIYVASETLTLPGVESNAPGAGVFRRYDERRRLTAPDGNGRSNWRLPTWFDPARTDVALTYHPKPSQWRVRETHVELDTVGRGQEFVFDADVYPEALTWFGSMLP